MRSWIATTVAVFHAAFLLPSATAVAHPGGVDKNGCHKESQTGERHCHAKKNESVCDRKAPVPGDDNVFYGPVINVMDGDTFKAKIQGVEMNFRMADIDAPELDQPYGREAQKQSSAALKGKEVVMLKVDDDHYGRQVVHVWIGPLHLNRELVAVGAAWFYPEYAHDNCLFNVEEQARDEQRGLWKLPSDQRVEPWVWRERKRQSN